MMRVSRENTMHLRETRGARRAGGQERPAPSKRSLDAVLYNMFDREWNAHLGRGGARSWSEAPIQVRRMKVHSAQLERQPSLPLDSLPPGPSRQIAAAGDSLGHTASLRNADHGKRCRARRCSAPAMHGGLVEHALPPASRARPTRSHCSAEERPADRVAIQGAMLSQTPLLMRLPGLGESTST